MNQQWGLVQNLCSCNRSWPITLQPITLIAICTWMSVSSFRLSFAVQLLLQACKWGLFVSFLNLFDMHRGCIRRPVGCWQSVSFYIEYQRIFIYIYIAFVRCFVQLLEGAIQLFKKPTIPHLTPLLDLLVVCYFSSCERCHHPRSEVITSICEKQTTYLTPFCCSERCCCPSLHRSEEILWHKTAIQ